MRIIPSTHHHEKEREGVPRRPVADLPLLSAYYHQKINPAFLPPAITQGGHVPTATFRCPKSFRLLPAGRNSHLLVRGCSRCPVRPAQPLRQGLVIQLGEHRQRLSHVLRRLVTV